MRTSTSAWGRGQAPWLPALLVLVSVGLPFFLSGCATQSSDAYIDQVLQETLGEVPAEPAPPVEPAPRAHTAVRAETPPAAGVAPEVPAPATAPEAAVADAVPCPGVVTIQPEAILWISVAEDPSLDGRYKVGRDSEIDFSYVGMVRLPNMTVEQAEAKLRATLEGRYLNKAAVSVRIAKASYDRVGVAGAVRQAKDIPVEQGCTISLREALLGADGVKLAPGQCKVKIIRNGLLSPFGADAPGEVYDMGSADGVLKVPEVRLQNQDLVYVFIKAPTAEDSPEAPAGPGPKTVLLLGEVPRRGTITFAENEPCTMMYLLFKIGGLPRFARSSRVQIVRRDASGAESRMVVNADSLMRRGDPDDDVVLQSGDRIIVPTRRFVFF